MKSLRISLLEPFFSGSHRQWAEDYARHSQHELHMHTMPGRHWKWRMHGGAVHLAQEFLAAAETPDLILTTDMLDLATFLALTRARSAGIPAAVYFHENQLAYPWSETDADPALQRDRHYIWLNYTTALAADALFFNSAYNRDSFLDGLGPYLKGFPDRRGAATIAGIRAKASVLPLGMDLESLQVAPMDLPAGPPVLLWNHRWEYDKGADAFFRTLALLKAEGLPFRLVVLGEGYGQVPEVFEWAQAHFREEILHWGYAESRGVYAAWLQAADILPVTSRQDFFGGSVVEAMACGCQPLLPRRLAYPGHVPAAAADAVFYDKEEELLSRLRAWLLDPPGLPVREWVAAYDWSRMAPQYDSVLRTLQKA